MAVHDGARHDRVHAGWRRRARDDGAVRSGGARRIAGLGNETQIHVATSAEVACLNPGEQFPSAANKQTVTAEGDFPVQNGKATFELTMTAIFQPKCAPPMTLVWGPVTITVSGSTFEAFSTTITP